ncbi:HemK2/MTQ2 family protein methyltransferase [Streptomyces sp. NPDC050560]|uniref:HemK2/MTQ2 family protein methyltransferase n=1 Tax=Streptomyces sp. NPDC050560 TaxID=3365630 RepID=UPI0037A1E475
MPVTTAAEQAGPPGPLLAVPGVYRPGADTLLLVRALCREGFAPGAAVLDLGTGSGALALCAARLGGRVTAVDAALPAVLAARLNARRLRQPVRVRRGDLFAPVVGDSFDLVVSNPPYVPSPGAGVPRRGAARAWDAGGDGRALVDRVCAGAPAALRPGGVLLMVHSGLCDTGRTLRLLAEGGLRAEVSDRAEIPFGPVLRSRLDWLAGRGLVRRRSGAGAPWEELVVVRAERP